MTRLSRLSLLKSVCLFAGCCLLAAPSLSADESDDLQAKHKRHRHHSSSSSSSFSGIVGPTGPTGPRGATGVTGPTGGIITAASSRYSGATGTIAGSTGLLPFETLVGSPTGIADEGFTFAAPGTLTLLSGYDGRFTATVGFSAGATATDVATLTVTNTDSTTDNSVTIAGTEIDVTGFGAIIETTVDLDLTAGQTVTLVNNNAYTIDPVTDASGRSVLLEIHRIGQ